MKMSKRRKIMFIIMICCFLSGITVFAGYTFDRIINGSSNPGQISIKDKGFINYSDTTTLANSSDCYDLSSDTTAQEGVAYYSRVNGVYSKISISEGDPIYGNVYVPNSNFYRAQRLRVDTVCIVDDIVLIPNQDNTSYTGVSAVSTAFCAINNTYTELTATVNGSNIILKNNSTTFATYSFTTGASGISITSGYQDGESVIVDPDGAGFTVLKTIDSSDLNSIEADQITCSATQDKYEPEDIYLNQLGFTFTFTPEIAVFLRINFNDAWIRTRKYSSQDLQQYVLKDQISGRSPFAVSDEEWYYDAENNCAYLKRIFVPEQNEDLTYQSQSYNFMINQTYFYQSNSQNVFTEYVQVQVSFTVDMVQANRAKDVWGFDPLSIQD